MPDSLEALVAACSRLSKEVLMRRAQTPLGIAIDLFSGVGGLSLGARRAGLRVLGAVDSDLVALETHAFNFTETRHVAAYIEKLSGNALLRALRLQGKQIDCLIGGPPCQGFSEIGKRRSNDPRNTLFGHFFRLVREIKPKFFVVENVPGILTNRYQRIRDAALDALPYHYQVLEPITVSAEQFGVPTSRTRVFFIGTDTRRMPAIKNLGLTDCRKHKVTVRQAFAGMPAIRSEWQDEMRSWRQMSGTPDSVYFRKICGSIPDGVGNEVALYYYRTQRLISGCLGTKHSKKTIKRFSTLRPGDVDRVSGAIRLDPEGLCPTIRAGTGPDRGSYQAVRPIHPSSPRVITPREAARLQGFPDWFLFHPTKWHSFRQIGNSVSPIVAEQVLRSVLRFA